MPKCSCSGQTCGCAITGGAGVGVTGTGTAADPFILSVDPSTLGIGGAIAVSNSSTIEFLKTGSGAAGDPVVITGGVFVRSPNNTRYTIAVSNTGVLSAVAA